MMDHLKVRINIINKKIHTFKIQSQNNIVTYYIYKNTTKENYNYIIIAYFIENLSYYIDNKKHKLYLLELEDIKKNKRKLREIKNIRNILSGKDIEIMYFREGNIYINN